MLPLLSFSFNNLFLFSSSPPFTLLHPSLHPPIPTFRHHSLLPLSSLRCAFIAVCHASEWEPRWLYIMMLVTTFHSVCRDAPPRPLGPLVSCEEATFRTQSLSPTGLISSLLKANKEKGESMRPKGTGVEEQKRMTVRRIRCSFCHSCRCSCFRCS